VRRGSEVRLGIVRAAAAARVAAIGSPSGIPRPEGHNVARRAGERASRHGSSLRPGPEVYSNRAILAGRDGDNDLPKEAAPPALHRAKRGICAPISCSLRRHVLCWTEIKISHGR
jgi:hypothetical protein